MVMGASVSKDTELEEALAKFDDGERQRLNELFHKLSSEIRLDKAMFKQHMSKCFPEPFGERIFNGVMMSSNTKQVSQKDVSKRDFLIGVSHILKGSLNQRAQALLYFASTKEQASMEDLLELCKVLIEGYIKAIQESGLGSAYMHAGSSAEANKRFAEMLLKSITEEKQESGGVTENDVENWMRKEVLLTRLFEDAFKACFLGGDSVLETHWHGLQEGCEPTVEHVPKSTDILLPCKLDFQGHNIKTILDIPSMLMLNHAVPSECRHIWRLLFSTSCHGKSFTTFLHRIVYQGPTILLIKDRDGTVFGGFASTSWKVKSCFNGDTDCFVFTLKPSMSVYHPTGINDHYMYLNVGMQTIPNGLGMGGQFEYFGLWLDSEFGPGHSKARPKCTTYGSPQLSGSEEFQVEDIEVWGVGVPPELEEKQRSVLDTETDAKAILDLIGKERKSEGLREPEDSD